MHNVSEVSSLCILGPRFRPFVFSKDQVVNRPVIASRIIVLVLVVVLVLDPFPREGY